LYVSEKYIIRTYCHEAAHVLDKDGIISSSSKWNFAMKRDKSLPSDYASNAKKEDFAESVAEYYFDKESFKIRCPKRYAIIKELLNSWY